MSTSPRTWLTGRNKIVTAASIGAVSLASVFAIGANLGILTSAEQGKVGTVSAAGDLVPADTRVVDVYLDQQGNPATSTTTAPPGSQRFAVDDAGTVDVSTTGGRAHLDLIDPSTGWSAAPVRTRGADLAVSFTNGDRTLEFTATVGADGTVTGDVSESTGLTPAAPTRTEHESEERYEGADSDD